MVNSVKFGNLEKLTSASISVSGRINPVILVRFDGKALQ